MPNAIMVGVLHRRDRIASEKQQQVQRPTSLDTGKTPLTSTNSNASTTSGNPLDSNSSLATSPVSPTTDSMMKDFQDVKRLDAKTSFPQFKAQAQDQSVRGQLKTGWNSVVSYISRMGSGGP